MGSEPFAEAKYMQMFFNIVGPPKLLLLSLFVLPLPHAQCGGTLQLWPIKILRQIEPDKALS